MTEKNREEFRKEREEKGKKGVRERVICEVLYVHLKGKYGVREGRNG